MSGDRKDSGTNGDRWYQEIVEIKALKGLDNAHLAQVSAYLAVSGCSIGLSINFGERSLRHRRVFPPQKVIDHLVNRQWLFVPEWLKGDKEVNR